MSLKAKCEATWSDFKRNVAVAGKNRDMSAIYGSSILLQHSPPEYLIPPSRRRKRKCPSIKGAEDGARCGRHASMPISFTKVLRSEGAIHTAECCRLSLPQALCEKHKVERNVTMTDSGGRKLWHMRFQPCDLSKRGYVISNGWREFSYDHSLKVNDRLVFTLLSTSHFVVEFATSGGSTRAMLPTRDGKDYPWKINYSKLNCLSSTDFQGVKKKGIFRKNVAVSTNRDTSAVNGSSILLEPNPPDFLIPSSRRRKRSPSEDGKECANSGPASTPRSFTKKISLKCGIHTVGCCRLILPRAFCENHKVERNVTMTDSTGHKLWAMRFQSCSLSMSSTRQSVYAISNGWREFAYDHNLKANDRLVFILVSTLHFVVEIATSNGSTRAMLPRKGGKHHPWRINTYRLDYLSFADVQGEKKKEVRKKVASIVERNKQQLQKEMFCQCDIAKVGKITNNTNDSRKEYVLPEFTHLECKNPDGSSYLQIVDSDSDSEMTTVDGD